MKELLDLTRREYEAAHWVMDEEKGYTVGFDGDVRNAMFERFMQLHSIIQTEQMQVKARCLAIGYALLIIKREKLYNYVAIKGNVTGYSSFKKFCKEVFGFPETTAKTLVRVAEEYLGEDGGVKVGYLNFSYSQLVEMLSIEESYRPRILTCYSVRDIRRVGEVYKIRPPKDDETIEDTLSEWKKLHDEAQAHKLAKKNALCFIPAKVSGNEGPTSDPVQTPTDEDEDERDLFTPSPDKPNISFEAIRNGLLRQLQLLRESEVGSAWAKCADIIENAFNKNAPSQVAAFRDIVKLNIENADLKGKLQDLEMAKSASIVREGLAVPPGEKLNLKNAKERKEWLENYHSWPVWLEVPEVSKTYYRYDFLNGDSLIIETGIEYWTDYTCRCSDGTYKARNFIHYAIISKERPKFDSRFEGGVSGIVDYLTKHSKEI